MILIAICAGLKIYPAILGLLYIKEKRWKETVRLVIYGGVLFFGPFVFFGGFASIQSFFRNTFSLFGEIRESSISGFTVSIVEDVFGKNSNLFATVIQQLYLVFSLTAFFCAESKRSETLILCGIMSIYLSSSWMYTCIYMLPALLVFFSESQNQTVRLSVKSIPDILVLFMFFAVFSRPALIGGYKFIYGTMCIVLSLYNLIIIGAAVNRRFLRPIIIGDQR